MAKKSKKSKVKENKYLIISVVLLAVIIITLIMNIEKLQGIEVPFTPKAAAVVNGEIITTEQLDTRYEFFFYITGYPEQYKSQISKQNILDNIIDERLLLQEAKKEKIKVAREDVEKGVEEVAAKSKMSLSELEMNLIESGFSISYLQTYYENQIKIAELLNRTLTIKVTDKEIQEYYNNNQERFIGKPGEIRARHILVETEKEAEEIYQELQKTSLDLQKEKFKELAKEKSIGPSAPRGGDLGFFGKGMMVKEFEDEVFSLSVNEISSPVKTQFGWHIIIKEGAQIYLQDAKEEIRAVIKEAKQREAVKVYVKELREEAEISLMNEKQTITGATCYENYQLTPGTIIFYHTASCPYCKKMMPIVKELEQEGYTFHWAEVFEQEAEVVKECYQDVLQGGVPEFICAGNKEFLVGARPKEKLKEFADNCIKDR